MTNLHVEEVLRAKNTARSLAMAFLLGSDQARYGRLIYDLENDFVQGRNPATTIAAAYNLLLTNWKQENRYGWQPPSANGIFNTIDGGGPGGTKQPCTGKKGHITCHGCAKKGHFASKCPDLLAEHESTQSATTLLMSGVTDGEFVEGVHFEFLQDGQNGVTCQIGQDG